MDWIDANGVALRYQLCGNEGPLLILIHEMGGTLESWDGVVSRLAGCCRILRFDMRGAGLSQKITGETSMELLAADLAGLLDALDIDEPAVVAGCAVGAGVAFRFALDYPKRTAAVVVLNPAIDAPPAAQASLAARAELVGREGMRSIEASSLDTGYPTSFRNRDPDHYEKFRCRWLANDPISLGWLFRMLAASDFIDELHGIGVPVLALSGVHDMLRPPSYVRKVVGAIPDHTVIEIDAAHHVPDQAPDIVAQHIAAFLDRVASVSKRAGR